MPDSTASENITRDDFFCQDILGEKNARYAILSHWTMLHIVAMKLACYHAMLVTDCLLNFRFDIFRSDKRPARPSVKEYC